MQRVCDRKMEIFTILSTPQDLSTRIRLMRELYHISEEEKYSGVFCEIPTRIKSNVCNLLNNLRKKDIENAIKVPRGFVSFEKLLRQEYYWRKINREIC